MKRNWCGSCSERSRKAPPSASSLMRVVEPAGLALAGDAVALDVAQVGARRAEVAGPLAGVARLDDDAAAAGRDQAGAGEHARRHAAPPRARRGCGRAAAPCRRRPCRPARGCASSWRRLRRGLADRECARAWARSRRAAMTLCSRTQCELRMTCFGEAEIQDAQSRCVISQWTYEAFTHGARFHAQRAYKQ